MSIRFPRNLEAYLTNVWNAANTSLSTVQGCFFPWRPPAGLKDDASRGFYINNKSSPSIDTYEASTFDLNARDARRFRVYNSTPYSKAAAATEIVTGGLGVVSTGVASGTNTPASMMAFSELETTQIGPSYLHPGMAGTVNTTSGAAYLTGLTGLPTWATLTAHAACVVRITSGADQGVYLARGFDYSNSRLYLSTLDGLPFSASATASAVNVVVGPRMSFFNETNVIPAGVGTAELDGLFDPGTNRESYILRVRFEKTGNTTPGYTQGSYVFSLRPWHLGNGNYGTDTGNADTGALTNQTIRLWANTSESNGPFFGFTAGMAGSCPAIVLDEGNQRLWGISTNGTSGSIFWWWYKSPECLREVASTAGTPLHQLPGLELTTGRPVDMDVGSDGTVYVALAATAGVGAGWVRIAPDLTVTRINAAAVGLSSAAVAGLVVDRASARTGGSDPDRIYLLFSDTTTGAGKVHYFEADAFGTLVDVTVTMTNGAQLYTGDRAGHGRPRAVDQSNGVLYWVSSDGAQQVNRFDPAGPTWSRRLLSDFNGANGGTGTISNPTVGFAVGVNPHAAFRELWVGTDAGHIKLDPDDFAGAFERYFGSLSAATPYSKGGFARTDGSTPGVSDTRLFHRYAFGVDGRVFAMAFPATGAGVELVQYNRSNDAWVTGNTYGATTIRDIGATGVSGGFMADPYGGLVTLFPHSVFTGGGPVLNVHSYEIHYQWVSDAWTPKEWVRGALPDTHSSPGLLSKPLHATMDALVMGVRIRFTPQGGATPHTNEFLGTIAQTATGGADGATATGSSNFSGSGFAANQVGALLRIESGADAGVYRISGYINANQVGLTRLNGTAFNAAATVGTLPYTVWQAQASAGPETVTCFLANGYGKDNTLDMTGITTEFFFAKTVVSDQEEDIKFCLPPLGPSGSTGPLVYFENFPRATSPNYNPATGNHRALPGAPSANGTFLLTGGVDAVTPAGTGRPTFTTDNTWGGRGATDTTGFSVTVDFGAPVEVGSAVLRLTTNTNPPLLLFTDGASAGGSVINLYKTSTTPTASSAARTSGTSATASSSADVVTLNTGDFLGPETLSATDGATVANTNTFTSTPGRFVAAHVGQALVITAGGDLGATRIVAVSGDGASCTVRNLNQAPKLWTNTASGITFEVRDAVREEDMLVLPSGGAHHLQVEMLNSPTEARIRTRPSTNLTGVTWQALKPTWDWVKRISHATDAAPPDVSGNGTYVTTDGQEAYQPGHIRAVADLSDLAVAARTGRYWKFTFACRNANRQSSTNALYSLSFYDTAGVLIGVAPDTHVDSMYAYANFIGARTTRLDFIVASDTAASHVDDVNGVCTVGGTRGDTVTLTAGRKFLGYQLRGGAQGSAAGGTSTFTRTSGTGDGVAFTAADVGRTLRILSGTNAGYYRITNVLSATQVTLATPAGNGVVLGADAGPTPYAVHDGINANPSAPDFLALTTDGVGPSVRELTIIGISDDLTTLTVAERSYTTLADQNWEIRRRATPSTATTADNTIFARLLMAESTGPLQRGDVSQDSRGTFEFHAGDIGTPVARADGGTTEGSADFSGSDFTPDDVGRVLVILSGADQGPYRIGEYAGSGVVALKDVFTGVSTLLTATASGLAYHVVGASRFRISRYVTLLRS